MSAPHAGSTRKRIGAASSPFEVIQHIMRKQTRPFAVEIKRNKRSRDPSPFSDLPADIRAAIETPFKDAEARLARAVAAEPAAAAASATPRILEDTTPARTPPPAAEAEVVRPRRGRPPKIRPEAAAALPDRVADQPDEAARQAPVATGDEDGGKAEEDAFLPAAALRAAAVAEMKDDAPAAPGEADGQDDSWPDEAGPDETGTDVPAATVARTPRVSRRRAKEGNIGQRWKRHLPRWKR